MRIRTGHYLDTKNWLANYRLRVYILKKRTIMQWITKQAAKNNKFAHRL